MNTLLDIFNSFPQRGNKAAFIHRTGARRLVFTYRKIYDYALKMGAWLESKGVKPGDRIIVWAPNSAWWAVVFWGAVSRGVIIVPVDFTSSKDRANKIAGLTQSRVIVQSRYKLEKVESNNAYLIEDLEFLISNFEIRDPVLTASPDDIAELIYTSGTTGDPKGVVLTHRNILSNTLQINKHIPIITEQFGFLSVLPLSHMFEQTGGFFTPLLKGSSVVYIQILKPSAIMEALAEENIYMMILVPRLLQALKDSIENKIRNNFLLKHLNFLAVFLVKRKFGKNFKYFVSGGAALDVNVGKFWQNLGFVVLEGYGLTECSPVLAVNHPLHVKLGTVGRPVPQVLIKLTDGEVLAKGENIFGCYWKNPEATREAFTPDGWFKTGDLGTIDKEGYLTIRGRKKDVIVTAEGINIYPDDIENILNKTEGVRESCVISKKTPQGEIVHAVLLLKNGAIAEKIIVLTNENLEQAQKISSYSVWPDSEFPKTTTLKIQKFLVKQKLVAENPENKIIEADLIIKFVSEVTGVLEQKINDKTNIAQGLGISSLGRLELVNLLEQEYRLDLGDSMINQSTTVGDLRRMVENREYQKERTHFRIWTNKPFFRFIRKLWDIFFTYPIFRFFVKTQTEGLENLGGLKMPVIFIANHVSYFDHPAIYFALPAKLRRRLAAMAREEFFFPKDTNRIMKFLGRVVYEYGTVGLNLFLVPHNRGFRASYKFMGRLLDIGVNVLIFPEGRRSWDGELLPFEQGLGMMVKEMRVPVVPIKITDMGKIFPRGAKFPQKGKVKVIFGKPLFFENESTGEILDTSRQAILNL